MIIIPFLLGVIFGFPVLVFCLFSVGAYLSRNLEKVTNELVAKAAEATGDDRYTSDAPAGQLNGASAFLHRFMLFGSRNYMNTAGDMVFRTAAQHICDSVKSLTLSENNAFHFTRLDATEISTRGTRIDVQALEYPGELLPPEASPEAFGCRAVLSIKGNMVISISGRVDISTPLRPLRPSFDAKIVFKQLTLPLHCAVDRAPIAPFVLDGKAFLCPMPQYLCALAAPPPNLEFDLELSISSIGLTDNTLVSKLLRASVVNAISGMCGHWFNCSSPHPSFTSLDARGGFSQETWSSMGAVFSTLSAKLTGKQHKVASPIESGSSDDQILPASLAEQVPTGPAEASDSDSGSEASLDSTGTEVGKRHRRTKSRSDRPSKPRELFNQAWAAGADVRRVFSKRDRDPRKDGKRSSETTTSVLTLSDLPPPPPPPPPPPASPKLLGFTTSPEEHHEEHQNNDMDSLSSELE